ncbi:hypothetical protein CHS0354_022087, partial [Potamilus streckersoni]
MTGEANMNNNNIVFARSLECEDDQATKRYGKRKSVKQRQYTRQCLRLNVYKTRLGQHKTINTQLYYLVGVKNLITTVFSDFDAINTRLGVIRYDRSLPNVRPSLQRDLTQPQLRLTNIAKGLAEIAITFPD